MSLYTASTLALLITATRAALAEEIQGRAAVV